MMGRCNRPVCKFRHDPELENEIATYCAGPINSRATVARADELSKNDVQSNRRPSASQPPQRAANSARVAISFGRKPLVRVLAAHAMNASIVARIPYTLTP